MIVTSPSNGYLRAPRQSNQVLQTLVREATELGKALLQPSKFIEEVKQVRAQQVAAQTRSN